MEKELLLDAIERKKQIAINALKKLEEVEEGIKNGKDLDDFATVTNDECGRDITLYKLGDVRVVSPFGGKVDLFIDHELAFVYDGDVWGWR